MATKGSLIKIHTHMSMISALLFVLELMCHQANWGRMEYGPTPLQEHAHPLPAARPKAVHLPAMALGGQSRSVGDLRWVGHTAAYLVRF